MPWVSHETGSVGVWPWWHRWWDSWGSCSSKYTDTCTTSPRHAAVTTHFSLNSFNVFYNTPLSLVLDLNNLVGLCKPDACIMGYIQKVEGNDYRLWIREITYVVCPSVCPSIRLLRNFARKQYIYIIYHLTRLHIGPACYKLSVSPWPIFCNRLDRNACSDVIKVCSAWLKLGNCYQGTGQRNLWGWPNILMHGNGGARASRGQNFNACHFRRWVTPPPQKIEPLLGRGVRSPLSASTVTVVGEEGTMPVRPQPVYAVALLASIAPNLQMIRERSYVTRGPGEIYRRLKRFHEKCYTPPPQFHPAPCHINNERSLTVIIKF